MQTQLPHGGFTCRAPYVLTPGPPSPGLSCPPASPHRSPTTSSGPTLPPHAPPKRSHAEIGWLASLGSALARAGGYGTINPLSIDYASRPRLRSRLTLGGSACPRNPWSSGGRVSHPACATHACILTRVTSTPGSRRSFHGDTALPYPPPPLNPPPKREQAKVALSHAWRCRGFGGVLEPRYIVGAESLDQ
jgi:hypothetical protein